MRQSRRKMLRILIVGLILLILAWACQYLHSPIPETDPARTVVSTFLYTLRNVIILGMLLAWCRSLYVRIVHERVRRLMICVGALLAFWLFVRHCKFEYTMSYHDTLGRYIWYSYYIPMVLVPLLGVFIVDYIGKPEEYRTPKWMNYLYIPAAVLITAVLTNDLHRLVFAFPEGLYWYDTIYNYRLLYFIVMAWFVLLGVYFVVALLRKCRIPGSRKMQSLPLLVLGFAVVFWTQYCLNIFRNLDLTAIDCLIIAALLESAIQSGLIPINTNYDEIFRSSTVAMQIVDSAYEVRYASTSAGKLPQERMKEAEKGPVAIGSTLLRSQPVIGGHALWQDDVSQIRVLQRKLLETQSLLKENNDLLRAELELKRQQTQLDEQNRLYDRIAQAVAPQVSAAEQLMSRLDREPENERYLLARLCVICAYLKRKSNLLMLGEENRQVLSKELEYSMHEVLDNLSLVDVFTSMQPRCEGENELPLLLAAYDCFYQLIHSLMDTLTAIMVKLSCKNGRIHMSVQVGCSERIRPELLAGLQVPCGRLRLDIQDEDVILDLVIEDREVQG